ncbi:SPOR domain-containing protein [Limnohabitans sp.]|uniref:SPOR domain-containing protein n=1 Tax=Limnohabitans sp. TaxID=1907725 RepID=UPI00286F7A94|nr:SPOR domain-containing protein [Limnohabitans sp.]
MNQQRGGTLVGFIIGLLVGLTVALGVAIYVTKVPIPFMNKGQTRSSDLDAAEAEKNKDWDPNAPLYGKKGAKSGDKVNEPKVDIKPEPKADAAAKIDPKSADPLGDLAKVKTAEPKTKPTEPKVVEAKPAAEAIKPTDVKTDTKPVAASSDPFIYFVQAGAYRSTDEAEAQRAKTVLLGLDTKISERDQGGRTVYRVRVGPMDKIEAERVRAKLDAAHIDSAMVRVQR